MTTSSIQTPTSDLHDGLLEQQDRDRWRAFWDYCLRREALQWANHWSRIGPLLASYWIFLLSVDRTSPSSISGGGLLRGLFIVAVFLIVFGGGKHATRAVSWELSNELRELVRLTGIGPFALLACETLSRWLTTLCMLAILFPVASLALTLGGVTAVQIWAYCWVLLMLIVLSAGLALVAAVSATQSDDSFLSAAFAVPFLMFLYHVPFWMLRAVVTSLGLLIDHFPMHQWEFIVNFAWDATPLANIIQALTMPDLISPLDLSYWIHFLTTGFCFRFASVVMIRRFRAPVISVDQQDFSKASSTESVAPLRPRCSDSPLFWKDAYILGGGAKSQKRSGMLYCASAIFIVIMGLTSRNSSWPPALGVIAMCLLPIIFVIRLDTLIGAEFRQQMWESLVLLPIDRRILLRAKVQAVAWEQRMAVVPGACALLPAFPHSPVVCGMTAVIALLAAILLAQYATLHHLTNRSLSSGTSSTIALFLLVFICLSAWCGQGIWGGFAITIVVLSGGIFVFHGIIDFHLRNWPDSADE